MTIITLDSIALRLLSSPSNCSPLDDLQLVVKVITGNDVIIESKPSAMSTDSEKSWTLEIQFEFPADCASLGIEITCTSLAQKKAFQLEHVDVNASDIVAKADNKQCFRLNLDVNSVDGVLSFHLRADFSIGSVHSEPQSKTIESNTGFPFNDEMIRSTLLRMLSPRTASPELDSNVLNDIYRSVQLLQNAHPMRSTFLVCVGHIYMEIRQFQSEDALDKAISIYKDAMVNAVPGNDTETFIYAGKYGYALRRRFQQKGIVDDINQSVSALEDAVRLTPDGHPDKPSFLRSLGMSLSDRFERLGHLSDINMSVSLFEDAVRTTPDGHPDKPSLLNNLGNSLFSRFERLRDLSDINISISVLRDAVRLTPDGHPVKHTRLNNLGNSLLRRFERLGDLSDIHMSVSVKEDAVRLTPDGHPDKPSCLNNLGGSFLSRFERLGELSDMNMSVSVFEDAVRLTPNGHPDKHTRLNNLGNSLLRRFERLGDLSDINMSVSVKEDAVRLIPDGHPDKPSWLNNLGNSLLCRFECLGDLSDMNMSVSVKEEAVRLTPDDHPDKPSFLNNLGNSLFRRFECFGDLSDIKMSVSVFKAAVRLTPYGHPNKPSWLINLSSSFLRRFEHLGDVRDINMSVSVAEDAVRLTPDGHPDKPSRLNNLGNSLLRRFRCLGDVSDINMSVSVAEDAVRLTPDGHPDKPCWLNNLSSSFLSRFGCLGDLSDMNVSVSVAEDAVRLTPDGHPDKPSRLNNLGASLMLRFERLGDLSDINMSVSVAEDAVQPTPDGHPDKPSRLNNLGNLLLHRFEHLGDINDINMSVSVKEEAVRLTPDDHPDKPSFLNNLGNSLFRRFERLKDVSDMNMSVSVAEHAVQLTPDGHPSKPSRLNNLENSLTCRFECLRDLNDIELSISVGKDVVRRTPDGHPKKLSFLNNLGISFLRRFERLRNLGDINMSISIFEDVVQQSPDGHLDKPSWLHNLGKSLVHRFKQLGDLSDMKLAGAMFEKAAKSSTGSSSIRFSACSLWAMYCHLYDHCALLHAYHLAFCLLPSMAWLGLSIAGRQHFLESVGPIVGEAVSAAINARQYPTAMEWMDQGHSIIWGQLLQLRTPVDDLRQCHPDIANRFTLISQKLEGAGTSDKFEAVSNDLRSTSHTENYHKLAEEREMLVKHIRGLDGFDRFLLPRTFSQLRMAARNGPVVSINVSKLRCDALIVMPALDDILHVPLEKFTYRAAEGLHRRLRLLLTSKGRNVWHDIVSEQRKARNDIHISDSGAEAAFEHILSKTSPLRDEDRAGGIVPLPRAVSDPETEFQNILAYLWHIVVKPILDGLAISVVDDRSEHELLHVWWCTTGFLTFLPIHAAGIYGEKAFPGSKLSDFVVSSYTPTLSCLITDYRPRTIPNSQVLAVALPVESQLYGTAGELDCVANRVGSSNIKKLLEQDATVDNVIAGLEESSFVHFACHGVQDPIHPNESALLLAESSRLTISRLNRLSLPHAQLAFLSACQTATGDETLVQEAVHLAAGMLSAGYRGVIATMWSIMDSDAPQVADEVYAQLFKDSEPDPTQAAHALHNAVKKLIKDSNGTKSFFEWVPFIHIGI